MDIILLNSSDLPIYQQIKHQIIEQILKGQLLEGEQLPSIRKLAQELKISVITTKRAYEELEREGYIDSVLGKGSFVSLSDKQMLRQRQLETVRKQLKEIVQDSKKYDITLQQLILHITQLYGED
ncbi:GntR family transcriptional regulator [Paenibacillus beijingensis]|uniref:GntR family transcriptional regulator n=1 Tax=Paenibacillus beijingensis TaxID=1126833 RepID=A0A0D5NGJ3_9BACL|nr:GntR family transcriptional regulator [Paenibacillus beijingensis]AJY74235.1 GntR family transcriptional regulator [Paenibacillus beijingensis]